MLLINQEENYKPNTVQSLLAVAVALQSPLKCAQCLHSVCSVLVAISQWPGAVTPILSGGLFKCVTAMQDTNYVLLIIR